jgi:large subunit ribosomal protein L32e
MVDKKLIAHKQKVKAKKPNFCRQETHRRKKLGTEWRKPKGVQSKLRLRRRGKGKMVSIGYRMPEEVRGLTKEGLRQVYVSNPAHLKYVGTGEVAIIKKVSNRTRLEILKAAQKANIRILNIRDIAKKVEELTAKRSHKKVKKEEKSKKKTKKEEEEKKKAKMSQKQAEAKQKTDGKTLESTVEKKSDTTEQSSAVPSDKSEGEPKASKASKEVKATEEKPVTKKEEKLIVKKEIKVEKEAVKPVKTAEKVIKLVAKEDKK